jgi:spore coat protein U-like protein
MRIIKKPKHYDLSIKNFTLISSLFLSLTLANESQAAKCRISSPATMNFGEVNIGGGRAFTTVEVICDPEINAPTNFRVCLTADNWFSNETRRYIYNLFGSLSYNLFYDAGYSNVIRNQLNTSGCYDYRATSGQEVRATIPIYGYLYPNQNNFAGTYRSLTLSTKILYAFARGNTQPTDNNVLTSRLSDSATMTVLAEYENACVLLSASDLDFGQISNLSTELRTSGQISLQCPNRVSWNISLDNGRYASSSQRRMFNGRDYINYDIYLDSGRTQKWDQFTLKKGNGNNNLEFISVYGSVPVQSIKSAGSYHDTITITLTY